RVEGSAPCSALLVRSEELMKCLYHVVDFAVADSGVAPDVERRAVEVGGDRVLCVQIAEKLAVDRLIDQRQQVASLDRVFLEMSDQLIARAVPELQGIKHEDVVGLGTDRRELQVLFEVAQAPAKTRGDRPASHQRRLPALELGETEGGLHLGTPETVAETDERESASRGLADISVTF